MPTPAADPVITCPHCRSEIRLNESLAGPLIAATRADYEARLAEQAKVLETERRAIAEKAQSIEAEVSRRLEDGRARLAGEEAAKARAAAAEELAAQKALAEQQATRLKEQEAKLAEAQAQQAAFLRKERELEDQKRELALTVERQVQAGMAEIRARTLAEAEEAARLKVSEKDLLIDGLKRQMEEMRRKAEQGSQQAQGEVLELQLERLLAARFPMDGIEPVAKGETGGDVLQRVTGPAGQPAGAILWESKRTKAWSEGWLAKLRADQRAAGAAVAVMVSEALPKGVDSFAPRDGVWVTHPRFALPLATVLRQSLADIAAAGVARDGQDSKMEQVYAYLTGPRFRHRVEAIVEKFTDMQADLDREKKAMTRLWARREQQIGIVLGATAGMYGDLQGIAGRGMPEIAALEMPGSGEDAGGDPGIGLEPGSGETGEGD
jgi:hypothetical protein